MPAFSTKAFFLTVLKRVMVYGVWERHHRKKNIDQGKTCHQVFRLPVLRGMQCFNIT